MSTGVFGDGRPRPDRRRAVRADVRDGPGHAQHQRPRPDADPARGRLRLRAARHLVLPRRRGRLAAGRHRGRATPPSRWPSSSWPAHWWRVACFLGLCRPWQRRGHRDRTERRRTAERPETAPRHTGTRRARPRRAAAPRPRGARADHAGARPWCAGRRAGRRARPGHRRRGGGGLGGAVRVLRRDGGRAASSCRPTPGSRARRHALRPGLPHQAVHRRRRGAAAGARHPRHRRAGRRLPPRVPRGREHGVTVRQLLTHTSGLRPELPLYDCPDDAARLALLRAEAPVVRTRRVHRYSDLNLLSSSSSWSASPAAASTSSSATASPARSA